MIKYILLFIFSLVSLISFGQTYNQELVIEFTKNPSGGQILTIGSCTVTFSSSSGHATASCSNVNVVIYIRSSLSQTLNESRSGYAQGFKKIKDFSDSTHGDITMTYDNDKTFTFTSSSSTNSTINFINNATSSVTEVSNTVEDTTLSVPEYQTKEVILSPNPVYDKLSISSPEEITSISIYSMFGQKVYASSPFQNDFEVDISFIPKGIYLVKAKTKIGNKTMKIRKE
jgi:hypothetical protein